MKDFKLDDHEKIPAGFQVPDGYFDSLPEKINEAIAATKVKVVPINNWRNTVFYAAAAILIVGLGITTFNVISVNQSAPDEMAIENYLASQPAITEEILAELLEKEDIENLSKDYNLDDQMVEDILSHNANLEQYIID